MERSTNDILLEMIDRPAFWVQDGIITQVNQAAKSRYIAAGTPVAQLLQEAQAQYASFSQGEMYLSVLVSHIPCGATVTRTKDGDLFVLDHNADPLLRALSLTAQQMRIPMHSAMTAADLLSRESQLPQDLLHLKRSLYQINRILSNMADAARYREWETARMENTDLTALYGEVLEKAATAARDAGVTLQYTLPEKPVFGLADREMLERAIFNLLSNAIKFSPKESIIEARVSQSGNSLHFSLTDQGSGIPEEILCNVFFRYRREPGLEESRQGIGLGMLLVQTIAAAHGGTVLIDQPEGCGTRVTLTIAIRSSAETIVRSPIRLPVSDYAGGRNRSLLELSDVLPAESFASE